MKISFPEVSFSSDDVVKFLALSGRSVAVFGEILKMRLVLRKVGELGLQASDEELQNFADLFREMRGFYSAEETVAFLENHGLTEDDLEQFCEAAVLTDKVKDHLCTGEKRQEYFVNHRASLDTARISVIVVEEENLAHEIRMQIEEDEADFHALARKYSIDDRTKYAGGFAGFVGRDALEPEISSRVFNAADGEVLGPLATGGCFRLILVETVMKAEMNEALSGLIRERLFADWIARGLKEGFKIERE